MARSRRAPSPRQARGSHQVPGQRLQRHHGHHVCLARGRRQQCQRHADMLAKRAAIGALHAVQQGRRVARLQG